MFSRCLQSEGPQAKYKKRAKQEKEEEITEFGQIVGVRISVKALV